MKGLEASQTLSYHPSECTPGGVGELAVLFVVEDSDGDLGFCCLVNQTIPEW